MNFLKSTLAFSFLALAGLQLASIKAQAEELTCFSIERHDGSYMRIDYSSVNGQVLATIDPYGSQKKVTLADKTTLRRSVTATGFKVDFLKAINYCSPPYKTAVKIPLPLCMKAKKTLAA